MIIGNDFKLVKMKRRISNFVIYFQKLSGRWKLRVGLSELIVECLIEGSRLSRLVAVTDDECLTIKHDG